MNIPRILKKFTYPALPKELKQNHIQLTQANELILKNAIREHFLPDHLPNGSQEEIDAFRASESGQRIIQEHTDMFYVRYVAIPWLRGARSLKGARILEIGCGTGTSSVALAEQGAIVTSLDIHEPSLRVARTRSECFGVKVDFHNCNATEIGKTFAGTKFDFIIFSASMEHMTMHERQKTMRESWDLLPTGAAWVIGHTPNRLWYIDRHTSWLPFFHWLPDEIALEYIRHSPRELYSKAAEMDHEAGMEFLIRGGRGISYHEFALYIKDPEKINVFSSLDGFSRKNAIRYIAWRFSNGYRYQKIIRRAGPRIHHGFYEEGLSLIIIKD